MKLETYKKKVAAELASPNTHPSRRAYLLKVGKQTWWTAHFKCVADSDGWGKKDATNTIGNFEAETEEAALAKAKLSCPGNWRVVKVKKQAYCHDGIYR